MNRREILQQLTPSQLKAFVGIKSGLNETIFLKGRAGTGKTFLLNHLSLLSGKTVHLTASSGAASLQLEDGRTVSSFLGLGLYDEDASFNCRAGLLDNSIVVIDEISLIGKKQWEMIMRSIKLNSHNWRSVKIVIAGDPFQMPPIYWDEPLDSEIKEFKVLELTEIVRQTNVEFISRLNDIREQGWVGVEKNRSWFYANSGSDNASKKGAILVPTRALMNKLNDKVKSGTIIIEYNLSDYKDPDKLYNKLKIWQDMKVIIKRNNFHPGNRYVNGDTGVVLGYRSGCLLVLLDRDSSIVEVHEDIKEYSWTEYEYESFFDGQGLIKRKKVAIFREETYCFLPVLPAHYLSVRQVQGSTLDRGRIHFAVFQAKCPRTMYTALSRFRSIERIYLSKNWAA